MLDDGQVLLRLRVLAFRDHGENLLDLGLGAVHVHVTDDYDGLHVRMVPGRVEVVEALRLEGLQAFLLADERAAFHLGAGEPVGEGTLHRTPRGVAALAALLDDDTALLVDLGRVVVHEVGVVAQDHQAGVHDAGTFDRDVVEHVLGLFETGGGIDVRAEFSTDGTEVVQDGLVREVLRAVEAHVLEEVGETVLVRGFLDGAHIGSEVELGTSGGELVVADVIGQSVVQMAHTDGRIVGEGGHRLLHGLLLFLLRVGRDGGHEREERKCDQILFHRFTNIVNCMFVCFQSVCNRYKNYTVRGRASLFVY